MPYICHIAAGQREQLHIFGGDAPPFAANRVRDYLRDFGFAEAHMKVLEREVWKPEIGPPTSNLSSSVSGSLTLNRDTGCACSVLAVVGPFQHVKVRPPPWRRSYMLWLSSIGKEGSKLASRIRTGKTVPGCLETDKYL